MSSFLLTSETSVDGIIAHYLRTRTDTLQLVDDIAPEVYPVLRSALPGVRIVQVIHVSGMQSVDEAQCVARFVDAILLDSGNPKAQVKTLGGTGNTHDWSVSRTIVDTVEVPVFLAGGLNADNVRQAIESVAPYGVDVCSGLRTQGGLDARKLDAFFAAIYR